METFAGALVYVLPIFILMIGIEMIVAKYKKLAIINSMDAVSSLSSGLTNVLSKVLGMTIYIVTYDFLLKHFAVFSIESAALQYVIGFISIDFYAYWSHRWAHRYNLLWNRHVIHHSSEEYNLPVALRQTISDFVQVYTFLLIPAAIFGIPTDVLAILAVVMLFGGFWYHTQLIGKMGFLEKIIVTPSHHRIHHAINPIYIDRNFGGLLIIWDKLFGTFQEELPDVKPIYGITRPVNTWNPVKINFLHVTLLIKDAWRTSSWKDRFRIWFMPTGWRPADVAEKYPVPYIKDASRQKKYMPSASIFLIAWSWAQLVITFFFLMFMISQAAVFTKTELFVYGFFIYLGVYSFTELMDKSKFAWVFELARLLFALAIISVYDGWFTIDEFIPGATIVVASYFILSVMVSLAFQFFEFKTDNGLSEARA